jgi:tetratricopeptide (TPR) repeat protein
MLNAEMPADGVKAAGAPGTGWRWRRVVFASLGLLVAGVALALWLRPGLVGQRPTEDDEDEDDPVPVAVNPGYVGPQACAGCHARRVAEFQRTRHFLACTPASGARAPGFAPGRGLHPTRDPRLHFEMTRSGDEFIATGVQDTPRGVERVAHRIELVYGAGGKADEMYFAWQGDRLYNLPVAWLYPLERWGNAVDSIQPREATASCLECHNTWAAHVPGTSNQFRREGMILGVTCERCHGPGREHAEYHRAHADDRAHAVLHPGTLARERLLEVCTQCHGNVKRRGPAFSYRPGEPLDAHYRTIHNKYPEEEQVANQVRSLRQSKCFRKSDMTCVTCHNPHRPDQAAAARGACLKCHTPAACTDQPRLPAAVRGDCAGCHMPPRVWMNVRFHTTADQYVPVTSRSDHRIAVHPEARQAVLLAWLRGQPGADGRAEADRLAAQLSRHWLDEADRRRRAARLLGTVGALREALKADPNPPTRQRLQEAVARLAEFEQLVTAGNAADQGRPDAKMNVLRKVLGIKPDYAPARGELGAMYLLMGNHFQANVELRAAAEDDPEDSYCVTTLAALAYREGRWADAAALFARADEIEPFDANIHHGWGLALLKLDRWADAEAHFRRALAIDPRHAFGSQGLGESLLGQGKVEEALPHARRAVRWTGGKNSQMLLTLADAYAAARRPADARRTLERAVAGAEAADPGLVPAVRARLGELRE